MNVMGKGDFNLRTEHRFLEVYLDIIAQRRADLRSTACPLASASTTEEGAEYITESTSTEQIREITIYIGVIASPVVVYSCKSVLIVRLPFRFVAEYLVRFTCLFESVLCLMITRILIRMIGYCKSPIGFLYFVLRGPFRDPRTS